MMGPNQMESLQNEQKTFSGEWMPMVMAGLRGKSLSDALLMTQS
jgi:hypothetical protein